MHKPLPAENAVSVLAFNDSDHDSSCYFRLADRAVHIESERFSRRKYDHINPMITFCELHPELVTEFRHVAICAGYAVARYLFALSSAKHEGIGDPDSLPDRLPVAYPRADGGYEPDPARARTPATAALVRHLLDPATQIHFCGHHACHAATAYFSAGYESALAISLDGSGVDFLPQPGEGNVFSAQYIVANKPRRHVTYGAVYQCDAGRMKLMSQLTEMSFGMIWHNVTLHVLGMKEGEEGTLMAMAAAGDPSRFRATLETSCLMEYVAAWEDDAEKMRTLEDFLSGMAATIREDQDRYDLAAALQSVTEDRIRAYLARFITAEHRNLCLAGGVFLNCQITGKIRGWFPWLENVYIPPAPYDGGLSIGAAQLVMAEVLGVHPGPAPGAKAPYAMGRIYSAEETRAALAATELPFRACQADEVLALLQEGHIVALFQGSAESGRRALGNRSIIAHPGFPGLKDRINRIIKHRQWFRPFAPMVLAEHLHEWFECEPGFESPYMSFAVPLRPELQDRVKNIVHLDGTGRVQTVHRDLSPRLHTFLSAWMRFSGLPVLLNTSFNDREPIVETPDDAVDTFRRTAIDYLYFADHGILVSRPAGDPE